jgi:hypothetical protein
MVILHWSPLQIKVEDLNILSSCSTHNIGMHTHESIRLAFPVLTRLRELNTRVIVWEPVPPSFKPDNLPLLMKCLPLVDVFAPGLDEIYDMWGPEVRFIKIISVVTSLLLLLLLLFAFWIQLLIQFVY